MRSNGPTRVGELRPSQMLTTFGVGAVIDLPRLSVMIMGLDEWAITDSKEIAEPRLLAAVRGQLGAQVNKLLTPPSREDTGVVPSPFDAAARVGVPVATFPRWQVCPYCRVLAPLDSGLFELKTSPYHPDQTAYVHINCEKKKAPATVPARFLVACEKGHIDDFPWHEFVHRGQACQSRLRLREYGLSGEASDVIVECVVCTLQRPLSAAFAEGPQNALPSECTGRRPHLRDYDPEKCGFTRRAILLGASNSWFPVMLSALSIPTQEDTLGQLVEQSWANLEKMESPQEIAVLRKVGQLRDLSAYSDHDIFAAIERVRSGSNKDTEERDLKTPEWEIFSHPDEKRNGEDFQLHEVAVPEGYHTLLERVVLVERLREVRALTGFTRIDPPEDMEEEGATSVERAPLSRQQPKWVPACEIRGEGIFLQFSESALAKWLSQAGAFNQQFLAAHRAWREMRHLDPDAGYPGLRYVLLHSFAHALIRQLALECGYATASIRERIYSREGSEDAMAGLLLYTAAPDSEGTLGGLVRLGQPSELARHLDRTLEAMALCASDPLCAETQPPQSSPSLHGAACHACLFLPETCCERGNRYLDRTLLVPTVRDPQAGDHPAAFFTSRWNELLQS